MKTIQPVASILVSFQLFQQFLLVDIHFLLKPSLNSRSMFASSILLCCKDNYNKFSNIIKVSLKKNKIKKHWRTQLWFFVS